MKYISTRGATARKQFSEVLLMGLAPDGGLMLPEQYPQIDCATLDQWRTLSYPELAFKVMSLFATDIPADDLRDIINRTYTEEVFGTKAITPVRTLSDGIKIQALSNGPTLAFKDMAMQFLGNAFEYVLNKEGKELNILGATSGDTGSAAEYALRGKKGVNVFMLSPESKMSAFQRAQMFSLQDANIHNIAVKGMFDDCQDIVKAVQNDAEFKAKYHIGTVNSINWGRIVAQVVYYFAGYFNATSSNDEKVSFCVPSGNFGNVCAAHIARSMGLPLGALVVATNENDVLDEFFRTGVYRPRSCEQTLATSSPSMDISKASNFERFIFDLLGRDAERVADLFGRALTEEGFFDLSGTEEFARLRETYGFVSGASTHADRLEEIRRTEVEDGYLLDPHTADGMHVARSLTDSLEGPLVVMETALPVKFAETILEATGHLPPVPERFEGIEGGQQRVVNLENEVGALKALIEARVRVDA